MLTGVNFTGLQLSRNF